MKHWELWCCTAAPRLLHRRDEGRIFNPTSLPWDKAVPSHLCQQVGHIPGASCAPPACPCRAAFLQKPPHTWGLHGGKFVPILQLGKTKPRGSKGKAGITGMAQPFDHPEHHLCQQTGIGTSQGSSPGPAKLGVPGGCGIVLQGTSTRVPAFHHLAAYRLLGKKDDK